MNPIFLSGLFGLAKGLVSHGRGLPSADRSHAQFRAPVVEEAVFRKLPFVLFGRALPAGYTAAGFALAHVSDEQLNGASALTRFADVFAGGLLYENAFKQYGLLGAIAAHAAHNIAVGLGQGHSVRGKKRRRTHRRR